METVRLTVQLRDPANRTRVTLHRDVPLKDVGARAGEAANHAATMFRREKRAMAAAAGSQE